MEFIALPRDACEDLDLTRQGMFLKYLLALIEISERRGLTLTSWSPAFRDSVWELENALGSNISSARTVMAARLSQVVFERRLPRADDLPLEELLRIRERRLDELEAFRAAIAETAVKIDGNQEIESGYRGVSA